MGESEGEDRRRERRHRRTLSDGVSDLYVTSDYEFGGVLPDGEGTVTIGDQFTEVPPDDP
jgi:hypothetical protein